MTGNMRNITILHAEDWTLGLTTIFETNFTNKRVLVRIGGGEGIRIAEFSRDTKLQDIKNYRGETRKVTSEELLPIIHQGDVRFWTWDGFVGMVQGFAGAEKKFRDRISDIKWRLSDIIVRGCTKDSVESLLVDIHD